jgi:hypothetical protein
MSGFCCFAFRINSSEEKYEDSCGNSTSPKNPEEAFFASEDSKAVPTESEVFCRSDATVKGEDVQLNNI